ncbi:class I SAM-dependent methyltransferase [Planctomycetota bacterium]
MHQKDKLKNFYDKQYSKGKYSNYESAKKADGYPELRAFIDKYHLQDKRCLEIGCGRGLFQDLVEDYTGVDISSSVRKYLHKPFYQASATELPFEDKEFDVVWSISALEHIYNPEKALLEMRRVLTPKGLLFLKPAWQSRSWAANGYSVRPYSDFNIKDKIVKASIPIRNSILFRSLYIFPRRLMRCLEYAWRGNREKFCSKKLNPNYDHFWQSDSDSVNSIDPYEAILWFVSHGDVCISYPNSLSSFFVRTGAIIFQIRK